MNDFHILLWIWIIYSIGLGIVILPAALGQFILGITYCWDAVDTLKRYWRS